MDSGDLDHTYSENKEMQRPLYRTAAQIQRAHPRGGCTGRGPGELCEGPSGHIHNSERPHERGRSHCSLHITFGSPTAKYGFNSATARASDVRDDADPSISNVSVGFVRGGVIVCASQQLMHDVARVALLTHQNQIDPSIDIDWSLEFSRHGG